MITVIGAGAGKAENLTVAALERIKSSSCIILRTEKMPIAKLLNEYKIQFETLDFLYGKAEDFDELNELIAQHLSEKNDCCYIVHGNALDDTSVALLPKESIEIMPGVSVGDCASAFFKNVGSAKVYTSTEVLASQMPSTHFDNVITCIDSDLIASDLKCALAEIYGDEYSVDFYIEDFNGNQYKKEIKLYELDMQKEYNHTASIYLKKATLSDVYKYDCQHLLEITERLCARNGCPWDSVQTHASLRPYLIEEAYEAVDTIDDDDFYRLYDELGDVLFQVAIHACIGKKCGEFDFSDITDSICRKMIDRHPTVFKELSANSQDLSWDEIKQTEKGLNSVAEVLHDVPDALPSLSYAEKIQYKAENSGINSCDKIQNINSIKEMLDNTLPVSEDALGELLFKVVKLCRDSGVNPELALRKKVRSYIKTFDKK